MTDSTTLAGVDRRAFLGLCATLGVGSSLAGALWQEASAQAPPSGGGQQQAGPITLEVIAATELALGLTFTPAEREMMVQDLNAAVRSLVNLRSVPLANEVSPALIFHMEVPAGPADAPRGSARARTRSLPRPARDADLAFLTVAELSELVRTRRVTSEELTRLSLARFRQHDPALTCVVNLTEERALRQAREADQEIAAGRWKGPLHGIPWGAKDLLSVPGYPTTWGSPIYKDQVLDTTATVVERLDAAGAVLVAKLSLGELAQGDVWHGGTTKNPWNLEQGSSGSSAGPASATAAGLVPFTIGSETLGSIVSPSTRCGVTGLRPTFGAVSRAGAMALSWSMDKLGPICRSVEDCALVYDAIRGPDGKDHTVRPAGFSWQPEAPLAGIRVGFLEAAFNAERATKAFDDATLAAVRGLGVSVTPVTGPADLPVTALRIILTAEAAAAFDELTRENLDDMMVRQVRGAWPNSFRTARFISAVDYIQANRIRTLLMQRMDEALRDVDVLVAPAFGGNMLLITNLTGHPTVVLPNGFNAQGAPVSITFIGKPFGEAHLLRVAMAYQDATDFHRRHPAAFQ
jgi:Asp-tRNA(Asn)/Glu-tRNA(Gln) amidotransferase A subunit family amidase